jgi:hypothetical protein
LYGWLCGRAALHWCGAHHNHGAMGSANHWGGGGYKGYYSTRVTAG